MGSYISTICCIQVQNNEGEPTFTNESNVIPEAKRASDQDANNTSQHDGTRLLSTESSDGSYNQETINEMLKELEEEDTND